MIFIVAAILYSCSLGVHLTFELGLGKLATLVSYPIWGYQTSKKSRVVDRAPMCYRGRILDCRIHPFLERLHRSCATCDLVYYLKSQVVSRLKSNALSPWS